MLLSYIVEAVARVAGSRSRVDGPPRLASVIAAMQDPITVIIDHFESVTNWESWDVVAALALGLPPGSQLAIGSRDALPLPTALLRAQGGLLEIGVADLAMEREEAAALLSRAGVEPAESELSDLVAHTEGWPTGLYLAALAARAGGSPADAVTFTGDDRFMGDYLRSELLERVSSEQVSFLTRSSILERMCGPLCDAVVGTQRLGPRAGAAGASQPAGRAARPSARVVPVPHHVPGTAACPSSADANRTSSAICTAGRRCGSRATVGPRSPSTTPRPPATTTGSPTSS